MNSVVLIFGLSWTDCDKSLVSASCVFVMDFFDSVVQGLSGGHNTDVGLFQIYMKMLMISLTSILCLRKTMENLAILNH